MDDSNTNASTKLEDEFDELEDEDLEESVDFSEKYKELDILCSVIDTDEEVNYTLVGYFNKVVSSFLVERKISMIDYFLQSETFSNNMLKHLYCHSITSLLSKFIIYKTPEN